MACLCCCLLSCQDDDEVSPAISEVSVLRNGEPWQNLVIYSSFRENCDTEELGFSVVHRNKDDVIRERLSISGLSTVSEERYSVVPTNLTNDDSCNDLPHVALNFLQDDGDVGAGGAPLITSVDNWVEITNYDVAKQEIRGKFQLTFYDTLYQDTIQFVNGEFYTSVLPDTRGEPE